MRKCAYALLSLCLAALLCPVFPSSWASQAHALDLAFQAGSVSGESSGKLGSSVTASSDVSAARASAAAQGVVDVQRVLSKTLEVHSRTALAGQLPDGQSALWKIPAATDFHEAFGVSYGYPAYNENYDATVTAAGGDAAAAKAAVLAEDEALLDYDAIGEDGTLYKGGSPKAGPITKLVRHTYGVSNYGSAISDTAPSPTKRLSVRMVRYGNVVTGLYAPPGEVVKVTLNSTSAEADPQSLGLQAYIGNFGGNSECVEIPSNRNYVRMPKAEKTLALDQQVNYIGSPFGGAILIYSNGIGATSVDMTVEGAVEMPTYTYGETTEAQLAEQLQAPGPYFAFTTPRGLRAVGPATLVHGKSASQIIRAMDFWDKAIGTSYQFEAGSFDKTNPDTNYMVEMFEPYIPAGAAVNMGNYCICPVGWGTSFLDGDGLITSGAWGQIHELNHSFPWGGAIDGMTEISNNVINALTYQLYTNIAANRTEPASRTDPASGGLSGWNWTTDLYTTVERLRLNAEAAKAGKADLFPRWNLQVYVPLQHAFGADRFINAAHLYHQGGGKYNRKLSGTTNSNVWMAAASAASGYNLGYYMRDVQGFPELAALDSSQTDYITTAERQALAGPLYIPSGCLYASGLVYEAQGGSVPANSSPEVASAAAPAAVSGKGTTGAAAFAAGKEIVEMGRAFRIPFGVTKTIDLNRTTDGGYVSVACGEKVEMVGYTAPEHGTIAATSDPLKLKYTPSDENLSDSFYVTLKLTVADGIADYAGRSSNVTFKISLLQESGGFTTSCCTWANPSGVARNSAVAYAVENGALDSEPVAVASSSVAGFDSAAAGTLAVTEGRVYIPKTGEVDLYVRGNYWFNTCVAASVQALPSARDAQSKRDWPIGGNGSAYDTTASTSRIKVYVVPNGGSVPADTSAYAAVISEGAPLYVRAYLMVNGTAGRFRIGYFDGDSVREFQAGEVFKLNASKDKPTPSIASFTRDKVYSYPDPAEQTTSLTGEFEVVGDPLKAVGAWQLSGNPPLESRTTLGTWGNTPLSNAVDNDLTTQFHGHTNGPYEAEFVFELANADQFNIIRYKGHATANERGKVKNYEVYVGDDLSSLRLADTSSPLCIATGTASQANNYGNFNKIDLDKYVSGKYVRLVARDAYSSNGQYYYAFSDFRVGRLETISGEGEVREDYATSGAWAKDDAFINTRTDLMTTASGSGSFTFTGTGVIMYTATGPDYGTMMVSLDGAEPVEVSQQSAKLKGQQPVFWKSGLTAGPHTVSFYPKTTGADRINVEFFEVKTGESGSSVDGSQSDSQAEEKELSIQLESTRFNYTGAQIEPPLRIVLGDEDVTAKSTLRYDGGIDAGSATVSATYVDDSGKQYEASESFEVLKAAYSAPVTAGLSGGVSSYEYKQAGFAPTPAITGAPAGGAAQYYYSDTPPALEGAAASAGISEGVAYGMPWPTGATSATFAPGTYYLWAVVSSLNYSDVTTVASAFTVTHTHTWSAPTYTWASDNSKVSATATCSVDSSHAVSVSAQTRYAVTTAPTASAVGVGTYTAEFAAPFTTQTKAVEIPRLEKQPITVTFDAGEGSVIPATATVYEGLPYGVLPSAKAAGATEGVTRQAWVFEGWFTQAEGGSEVTSSTVVTAAEDHSLHAHWAPTTTVEGLVRSGTITGSGGAPVAGAVVELRQGASPLAVGDDARPAVFTTGSDGSFTIPLVPSGTYNVVITAAIDGQVRTVTALADVVASPDDDSVANVGDLVIPSLPTDSRLAVVGSAPVVVGGLNDLADVVRSQQEARQIADGGLASWVTSVVVSMSVTEKDEWSAVGAASIREAAEAEVGAAMRDASAAAAVELAFFDVTLKREVTTNAPSGASAVTDVENIASSPSPLFIAIPFDFTSHGKGDVSVYRYHDGEVGALDEVSAKAMRPDESVDATYYLDRDNGLVCIYASEFSTYAVGFTPEGETAHEHQWGEWLVTKEPSADEPGLETRTCLLDADHVETREIPATAPSSEGGGAKPSQGDAGSISSSSGSRHGVGSLTWAAITMYRVYNPATGEHLFTADRHEVQVLAKRYGWVREGVAWRAPRSSKIPVFRLYNIKTGEHHYTSDAHEMKELKRSKRAWVYEGVCWYSDVMHIVPVYRLYNPAAGSSIGSHHFTTDAHEVKVLCNRRGWVSEGTAWYGVTW